MKLFLLLAFIAVPILEIGVFIEAGERFGLWPTLGAVILTAVIGTSLLRAQGFAVLMKARGALDEGRLPMAEVFDGACLLIAGALLLTPGFLTDAVGFALFVPALRAGLRRVLGRWAQQSGRFHVHTMGGGAPGRDPFGGPDETIIDADYEVHEGPDRSKRGGRDAPDGDDGEDRDGEHGDMPRRPGPPRLG